VFGFGDAVFALASSGLVPVSGERVARAAVFWDMERAASGERSGRELG